MIKIERELAFLEAEEEGGRLILVPDHGSLHSSFDQLHSHVSMILMGMAFFAAEVKVDLL